MFTIKRIIIGILTFFTILILVYSSYFYNAIDKSFTLPRLQNKPVGEYFFNVKDENITETESGNILLQQISSTDSLYSTNKEVSIQDNTINLSKNGTYFLQILSQNHQYSVTGNGYQFSISQPTNIIISTVENKTLILPLTTKTTIDLLHPETQAIENNIVLYPHEYIVFKPKLTTLVTNADISRVQQIFSINYTDKRLKSGASINPAFLSSVQKIDATQKTDIQNIVQLYLSEQLTKQIAIHTFLEQKFINISGQEMIEEYFVLFLNPKKKKAYYKNKILSNIGKILATKVDNNTLEKIEADLETLKNISPEEYKNIVILLQEHCINYIATSTDNEEKKGKIYDLFLKLSGSSETIDKDMFSYFNAFITYDLYNSNNLYALINTYTKKLTTVQHDRNNTGYLVYYLNEVLLGSFEQLTNGNSKEIEDVLGIFNTYVTLSKDYYISETIKDQELQGKMRQTGVKEYGLLLEQVGNSFQKTFFETSRDSVGRLIKKDSSTLSTKTIHTFEKNLKELQSFYQKYKKYLTDSRINILNKKRFSNAKKNFQEYLSALKDYDKYLSENDKKNSVFLGGGEQQQQEELNPNYAKKILGTFDNINMSRATIQSKNIAYCTEPSAGKNDGAPYCYQINNIQIGSRFFNFILTPSEGNKITHIFLNMNDTSIEIENGVEIKIDTLKEQFSDDIYTYKNFLATSFKKFKAQSENNQTTNSTNTVDISTVFSDEQGNNSEDLHEQELLRTVKNTLLLGDKGIFTSIKSFLDVKYNNIQIQSSKTKKEYNISLSNVKLQYENSKKTSLKGFLDSSFIFQVGKTSSFRNPKITIQTNSLEEGSYSYEVIGIIPIGEMEQQLQTIGSINKNILDAVRILQKKLGTNKLSIKYYVKQKTLLVNYGNFAMSINSSTKLIKKIQYKGKNYLTKLVSFDNLEPYINSLP